MPKKNDKDSDISRRFVAAIEHWYQTNGLKQNKAAEILGLSASTFGNIIRGEKGISFLQIDSISKKLNKDVAKLLIEGKAILAGEKSVQVADEHEGFTPEQVQAIEAFKVCMKCGGEGAELLARQAIDLASKKQADSGFLSNAEKRRSA